ncbi:MAG: 2-amino-4-hydroxy-6-hydroxymethyldihydropteridine diphosphokinase [Bacteroidales bacterium]|nr:2-amino-4-hydroxy-6-hydroxymethyldihydropteridine diphosphokinase [Bacteroidales bacterium]
MIVLLLGSNMGDRESNLSTARKKLSKLLGSELICSPVIKTAAFGFEGGAFLNQLVAFESDITPMKMLDICKRVEIEMGRSEHEAKYNADGSRLYQDRLIDVDILFFNNEKINTKKLTIPHPQVYERPFVRELINMFPEDIRNNISL